MRASRHCPKTGRQYRPPIGTFNPPTYEMGLGVVVEGADNVDYQNMVDFLDVLRPLGIIKVGLATGAGA